MKKKKAGLGFWILYLLFAGLVLALFELNKNTPLGMALALVLLLGFLVWRVKGPRAVLPRLLSFALLLAALFALFLHTPGPVRLRPAVEGKNGGVTGVVTVADGQLTG
ncbi:MAG: hypothetical protein J6P58_01680, partial [Oscillospiraceae bacterium]|nr:hypothetical protein [Oscillospiraceae bacterium]